MGWPHFRGVGELGNLSLLLFIGHWTKTAQRRMTAFAMIEHFNGLKDRSLRLLTGLIGVQSVHSPLSELKNDSMTAFS